jgi:hypothetical protein
MPTSVWEEGKKNEALELFRKLLKVNPSDNIGVRFAMLAILLGLDPDWEDDFTVKTGPMAGDAMDAIRVDAWFRKNAKKFPEEFKDWKRTGM